IIQHGSIKINGIVKHPALDVTANNSIGCQQVTGDNFRIATEKIQKAFEKKFSFCFNSQIMRPEFVNEVSEIEKKIRMNSFLKRKIIKQ
ncbi:MAG: hypothetical protein U9N54_00770, partial [candidate division Zixibacteria bacterium]|nr:hypothetical protein [candidate division Zixibacteria bacterium]